MERARTLSFFLTAILFVVVPVKQISAQEESTVSDQPVAISKEEIPDLQDQINELRSENYQAAIRVAENAGNKADRFLDITLKFITILSLGISLVIGIASFVVGKNFFNLITEMRVYAKNAKENASRISQFTKDAEAKLNEMKNIVKKSAKKEKDLNDTQKVKKSAKKEKDLNDTLEKVNQVINEVRALSNSANFISNATQYPGTLGTSASASVSPSAGTPTGSFGTCDRCGQYRMLNHLVFGGNVCGNCLKNS